MKIDIQGMKDSRSKQIGQRIRAERKKKGWSQGDLGVQITDMLGATNPDGRVKSQGNVSEWETGSRIPTFENLLCLSTLFNCDLGYIFATTMERRTMKMTLQKKQAYRLKQHGR